MITLIFNLIIPLYIWGAIMLTLAAASKMIFDKESLDKTTMKAIALWPFALMSKQGRNKLNKYLPKYFR